MELESRGRERVSKFIVVLAKVGKSETCDQLILIVFWLDRYGRVCTGEFGDSDNDNDGDTDNADGRGGLKSWLDTYRSWHARRSTWVRFWDDVERVGGLSTVCIMCGYLPVENLNSHGNGRWKLMSILSDITHTRSPSSPPSTIVP